ncbi:Cys-tRNA(Pro) deacylase [Sphingomonas sp. RS6]
MSSSTPATRMLEAAAVPFTVHRYIYDSAAENIGLHAAATLGASPAQLLKTLMALVDGKPALALVPADRQLATKRLAAALGGKSAELMAAHDAERVSGYKIGGISPFGQKRRLPVVIEALAMQQPLIYLNGGQRGLQVRLAPGDAARLLDARVATIIA